MVGLGIWATKSMTLLETQRSGLAKLDRRHKDQEYRHGYLDMTCREIKVLERLSVEACASSATHSYPSMLGVTLQHQRDQHACNRQRRSTLDDQVMRSRNRRGVVDDGASDGGLSS